MNVETIFPDKNHIGLRLEFVMMYPSWKAGSSLGTITQKSGYRLRDGSNLLVLSKIYFTENHAHFVALVESDSHIGCFCVRILELKIIE